MIDWSFIAWLEGGCRLAGYVPAPKRSQSGVTIATGVDLGCRSVSDLVRLGLSADLVTRLAPYCGLKRLTAKAFLDQYPLVISRADAADLDRRVKACALEGLVVAYEAATGRSFGALPPPVRTVVASVWFQYGSLADECPVFWRHVVAGDFAAMLSELKNFKGRYPSRREREACYMWNVVSERG